MTKRALSPLILTFLTLLFLPTSVKAENPNHLQKLLSTRECTFCDLRGVGLVMTNLSGVNLAGADLSRANLSQANLAGADLSGANLTGASLYGADLTGANLVGADLSGADLRNAYLVNAALGNARFDRAYIDGAVGIPGYTQTYQDFYKRATIEASRRNYVKAIEHYTQTLELNREYGLAYLGRALMRYRLTDEAGAIKDAQTAGMLFQQQKNEQGIKVVQSFLEGLEMARDPGKGGNGVGIDLLKIFNGIGSFLLQGLGLF